MNRLVLACAATVACAVGCGGAADTNTQNADRPAAATASPTAAAASPTVQAAAQNANAQASPDAAQGDVTGAYFASGKLPAEFSEIEHLSLATIDENARPAPLNGFIRPKRRSADDYKLVSPRLAGRELTFTTAAVGGVSYSFKGTFEKMGNFPENPPDAEEVVLRGTLTKLKDGSVVAETPVSFTYSAGG
ncbi:MAG TPA: hypothetical protein VK421_10555 [Pyrinomonadaceae bacterium]|nr:hypothetical protein [Pyrinomonadaceae bacterium]